MAGVDILQLITDAPFYRIGGNTPINSTNPEPNGQTTSQPGPHAEAMPAPPSTGLRQATPTGFYFFT